MSSSHTPTESNRFIERLATASHKPIITDGSIDVVLAKSDLIEYPLAAYNLTNPQDVEKAHREFADAGAELLQTNTEQASPLHLKRFRLADKAHEINRKGVWLARSVAEINGKLVAAVVGPVGKYLQPLGSAKPDEVRVSFESQIAALAEGEPDVLLLKSFIELRELELAIEAARKVAPHLPIIAQKTFPEDGALLGTDYALKIAKRLKEIGIDCIGTNGTVGPQRMLSIIKSFAVPGIAISAQPDIGIPTLVDGRAYYNATPEYVAASCLKLVEAGVCIIGADGGATPEHIAAIVNVVNGISSGEVKMPVIKVKTEKIENSQHYERLSNFQKNIGKKFMATVELDIPRGLDMSSVFEGASFLAKAGLDAVNISDGARARLRISSITLAKLVQDQCGIEVICHLACRDRNMVGLQSELLGAELMGVRNILAVTGDPAQIGDYPYATSVYDIDAIGLIRALSEMNKGRDLMGNPIAGGELGTTHFSISCGANPIADDMEREMRRLEQKIKEGCEVIFTQPIFEMPILERFIELMKPFRNDAKIMLGIIPLRSLRHAEFLHYEVPGMNIPTWIQERIGSRNTTEEQSAEGIEICVEFLKNAKSSVDGMYLMPPFKKYQMAVDIMERIA